MAAVSEKALCLLSLDGGGVRGLASLLILKRIMWALDERLGPEVKRPLLPCQYFDMIAGTSTGGLIAIMLGVLGMDVDTCINKYLQMAPIVFPKERFLSNSTVGKLLLGVRGAARFEGAPLESVVKAMVNERLKSGPDAPLESAERAEETAECRTFVCVTNKDSTTAFRLRSYHSSWEPGTGCTIWQAARATTAAPLYFPPIRFGQPPRNYVDGGITHNNNPVRALWDEAKQVWSPSRRIGCIVSIGTGVPALKSTGETGKSIIESLANIVTDTQNTAKTFAWDMEHLPPAEAVSYSRFNVEQGLQNVKLEEWESFDALTGATDEYMNTHRSEIEKCANAIRNLGAPKGNLSNVLPLISELPIASQDFFGRSSEMSQLCEIFHSRQSSQKAVVIWGFGGLGKTRLALQYVRVHQSKYSVILWINAATLETAVESFSQATSNIISRSKSISPHTSGEGEIGFVHRWLQSQAKENWLLVIDSLDDPEMDCRRLIPQWSSGNIMITSTLSQVAKYLDYQSFELGSISSAAGADMLLSKLPPSHDVEGQTDVAERIVEALGGVPLAIEQAGAIVQHGISIHDFLGFHKSQYQELMGEKPPRSAWYYDKNISLVSVFTLTLSKLEGNQDARNLLSLFSCFGHHTIAMDLLSEFWKSNTIIGDPSHLDISSLSEKIQWLKTLGHRALTFQLAIKRLESFCLLKTRMNEQSRVTSASVHSTICKWRLETIEEQERQDYIVLAALVLSQSLPGISMDTVPYLKHFPLIKYSYDMMQQYIEPRNLVAPNGSSGRLCRHYATVTARYAQVYTLSPYAKEAEAMLTATIRYEKLLQGSSWPSDKKTLLLLKHLASSFLKGGKFDNAVPLLESLCKANPELFGSTDDIPVWAAARLRDVREREILYGRLQQQAIIATNEAKLPRRLDGATDNEDFVDIETPLSDGEYHLKQTVIETERLSGPSDNETLQAVSDLARFYRNKRLYFEAGRSYEDLWHRCRSKDGETRNAQALADAVHFYSKSNRLTQQIKLNFLEDGRWAARYGDEETVELLIPSGAKINETDGAGHTALYWAAYNHNGNLVHRLLKANANLEICNSNGLTALHAALWRIDSSSPWEYKLQACRIMRMLIEKGANVHATSKHGQLVLWTAAQTGLTSYVQILLDQGVVLNDDGGAALEMASYHGWEDVVKLLLGSGIYDNAEDNNLVTALQSASYKGNPAVVQLLLASKAGLFSDLENLSKVFSTWSLEVIQVLFTFFIDIDTVEDSKTCAERDLALQAVRCAILDTGNPLLVEKLCERGIDNDQSTYPISLDATLLHNAAHRGHIEAVKILIASGADADKLDDFGQSPLSLAAARGREDVVALLLPITKGINTQSIFGETALSLALFGKSYSIVRMLLKAGAQIAPQEPGPHCCFISESERISGYGRDAILTLCTNKRPEQLTSLDLDILKLLLEAATTGDLNLGLDAAAAAAEPLSDPLLAEASAQAVPSGASSEHHSISNYKKALEILREEDWEAWGRWFHARAASAPQNREEVRRLDITVGGQLFKRLMELREVWDATLPRERAERLKQDIYLHLKPNPDLYEEQ